MTLFRRRAGRPPLVRQYAEADCGPCCLVSALRYWGGNASVAEVRWAIGTDLRGSSLYQLARAAAGLGLEPRGATGTYDELRDVPLPVVAHIVVAERTLHYVLVTRIDATHIDVMDPAAGHRTLTRQAFEEMWRTRAVLLLRPTDRLAQRPSVPWWRWIMQHLADHQAFVTQSVFLGALYTFLGLLTSLFVQKLFDEFIPERDGFALWTAGFLLLATLLIRGAAGYGRQRLLAVLQRRVGATINRDFVGRLFRLPLGYFERTRKGDVTSRLQDCLRVQTGALQIVATVAIDGVMLLGAIGGLLLVARPLTWIAVTALPAYGALAIWSARTLRDQQSTTLRAFADAESAYIDSLQGIREVLGSGANRGFAARIHGNWTTFLSAMEQFAVRQASLASTAEAVGSAVLVGTLVYGASLVMVQRLHAGELVGGYSLIVLLLPAIGRLADAFVAFQTTRVSGARVMDVLQVPPQPSDAAEPFVMHQTLSLAGASFAWPRGAAQLSEIDLVLSRGVIVGVTGANGSGKTTLIKLLRREYDLSVGTLLIDGRDARDIDLTSFRERVALLPSDVSVFAGSLHDNIALHRDGITPERVLRATEALGLSAFMRRFPAGLATPIGEEARMLSAGERFVLGLVRALVTDPDVLIIDEAFSMLDGELLRLMMEAILRFAVENAVLLVSHDPAILAYASRTYVLERGRLSASAQQGAPERRRPHPDILTGLSTVG